MKQLVIDTRPPLEFQEGHQPDAVNLPLNVLKKYGQALLSQHQPLVILSDEPDQIRPIFDSLNLQISEPVIPISDMNKSHWIASELIDPEDYLKLKTEHVLLDLRHPDEITRLAPDAYRLNIPLEELSTRYPDLDPSLPIYTLCGSGGRATTAASYLSRLGYHTIIIEGGIKALQPLLTSSE